MMPYYATAWNDTMKNLNLEIDNDNVDPTSPVGVGNLAGPPKPLQMSGKGCSATCTCAASESRAAGANKPVPQLLTSGSRAQECASLQ